jgi:hypothetical protein
MCVLKRELLFLRTLLVRKWAGIAQRYSAGLRAGWLGFRVPEGAENFSLHHRVQTGSVVHRATYPARTRGSFPRGRAAGAWSWPLTSIECRGHRMCGAIYPLPHYAFMAWCSVEAQGQIHSTQTHTRILYVCVCVCMYKCKWNVKVFYSERRVR